MACYAIRAASMAARVRPRGGLHTCAWAKAVVYSCTVYGYIRLCIAGARGDTGPVSPVSTNCSCLSRQYSDTQQKTAYTVA